MAGMSAFWTLPRGHLRVNAPGSFLSFLKPRVRPQERLIILLIERVAGKPQHGLRCVPLGGCEQLCEGFHRLSPQLDHRPDGRWNQNFKYIWLAFFDATLVCDIGPRPNRSCGQFYQRCDLRHYRCVYVNGSVHRPNGDNESVADGAVVSLVCRILLPPSANWIDADG